MNRTVIIIGKSGSGKTTLCDLIETRLEIKQIRTYTTKPPRSELDDSHVWSDIECYKQDEHFDNILCQTRFGIHTYWTRKDQIQGVQTLVVDVNGLNKLYETNLKLVVINLVADERMRFIRIEQDNLDMGLGLWEAADVAHSRINRDAGFECLKVDWVVDGNGDIEKVYADVKKIIEMD